MKDLGFILERSAKDLKFRLVNFEWFSRSSLRVYIEKPEGSITIDDCCRMSDYLTKVLAVEGIDFDRLEISSAGTERSLAKPKDFIRFVKKRIKVQLHQAIEFKGSHQKRFTGLLQLADENSIVLLVDGTEIKLSFSQILRANLSPDYEATLRRSSNLSGNRHKSK